MHLKSMRLWIVAYIGLTLFDVIVTFIFVSKEQFGITREGNPLIRGLMEQYGIWQGLTLYVIREFLIFFVMWGAFYFIITRLIKGRSDTLHNKVDVLIFNIGVPFIIMASALLHLFGGIFWIMVGITGQIDIVNPIQLIVYVTMLCGIFQAYQVAKVNSENNSITNQSIRPVEFQTTDFK